MTKENADTSLKRPLIGIGVMILNEAGEVLLGKRAGSHGQGEWDVPGGHVEYGETMEETARKEVFEETSLRIDKFTLISVCDEMRYIATDGKHYVNIGFSAEYNGGEIRIMEPNKCSEWQWFSLKQLPGRMMESTERMVDNYLTLRIYKPPSR